MEIISEYPQFFTATILDWIPVLKHDSYKQIVLNSLEFLVTKQRVYIYAFVIMDNHIHVIWQMREGHLPKDVQRDFLKFTAQQIRFKLMKDNPILLASFEVNLSDRRYQIWQRNSLSIPLITPTVFDQKITYIHNNPVKKRICKAPEIYPYSSASFYESNDCRFSFLSHHEGQ